ncbi:MAG: alpha/beta hydrolase-fold protein [Pyrinomonadaceae bacterium]
MLWLLVVVLCFGLSIAGQTPPAQVSDVIHEQYLIESKTLGEQRSVLVRVPPGYAVSGRKYPVVYMLDAHPPQNAMMIGVIDQQVWGGMMPEMIVVGIQNTDRSRDLTPTDDGKGRGPVGGGEKFLRFIEGEVIPLVEKNYRTEPFRIFAGHSLGGLFAVYALTARPDLFNAYIAASPVLGWDDNYVIKRAEEVFREKRDWNKTVFLAIGDEPQYMGGFRDFENLLKQAKPKDLEYEFRQFKDENHGSVVLRAYYWGLRKIFEGWQPPASGSIADLENHYRKLSKRFGYDIFIPEDLLNRAGYQMLNAGKIPEAIDLFRKNAEHYPNSANVYDSLGEAFEKNGQLKQARENYEKAFAIASRNGDQTRAAVFKANLDRVAEKLK